MPRWLTLSTLCATACLMIACSNETESTLQTDFGTHGFLTLFDAGHGASWTTQVNSEGDLLIANTSDNRKGVSFTQVRADGQLAPIRDEPFTTRFLGEHWLADLAPLESGGWLLTATVQTHERERHYIFYSQFQSDGTLNKSFGTNGQTSAKFFFDVWPDWRYPWPYWAIETFSYGGGFRTLLRDEMGWSIQGMDAQGQWIGQDDRGILFHEEVTAPALHVAAVQHGTSPGRVWVAVQACGTEDVGQNATCKHEIVELALLDDRVKVGSRQSQSGWIYDLAAAPDLVALIEHPKGYEVQFQNSAGQQAIPIPHLQGSLVDSAVVADTERIVVILPVANQLWGVAYVLHEFDRDTGEEIRQETINAPTTPMPHRLIGAHLSHGHLAIIRWTPVGLRISRHNLVNND